MFFWLWPPRLARGKSRGGGVGGWGLCSHIDFSWISRSLRYLQLKVAVEPSPFSGSTFCDILNNKFHYFHNTQVNNKSYRSFHGLHHVTFPCSTSASNYLPRTHVLYFPPTRDSWSSGRPTAQVDNIRRSRNLQKGFFFWSKVWEDALKALTRPEAPMGTFPSERLKSRSVEISEMQCTCGRVPTCWVDQRVIRSINYPPQWPCWDQGSGLGCSR